MWLKALLCIHVPAVYEKSSLIRCLQEAAEGQNDCIEEPTFVGAVLVCVSVVGSVQLLLLYKHVPHAQSWLKKKVCFLLKKERASAPCKSSSEMWFVEKNPFLGIDFWTWWWRCLVGHTSCSEHCEMRKTSARRQEKKGRKVLSVPFSSRYGGQAGVWASHRSHQMQGWWCYNK